MLMLVESHLILRPCGSQSNPTQMLNVSDWELHLADSGTQDDRKCSPRDSNFPVGLCMHQQCRGDIFNADSNECRNVPHVHVSALITR